MEQQKAVSIEFDQNIFPTAAESANASTVELGGKRWRKRSPQIGSAQLCAHDPSPAHPQLQAAPDGLDFRQLGHFSCRYVCAGVGAPWRARTHKVIFLPDEQG
jgi:hypothetical protein